MAAHRNLFLLSLCLFLVAAQDTTANDAEVINMDANTTEVSTEESSTAATTTTAEPTSTTTPVSTTNTVLLSGSVRFNAGDVSFSEFLSNTTQYALTVTAVTADLATLMGVPESWVRVTGLRAGSLIVDFVVEAPQGTDPAAYSTVASTALTAVQAANGTSYPALAEVVRTTTGTTISVSGVAVEAVTFPAATEATRSLALGSGAIAGIVIGVTVTAIVVVATVIAAVLLRSRRSPSTAPH